MKKITPALSLALLLAVPATALADTAGPTGRVRSLTINTSGSTEWNGFHGSVEIATDKRGTTTYYFGRTYCPGKDLSDAEIALLAEALEKGGKILVTPRYRNGQGGRKCIVSFTLQRRNKKRKGGGHAD